MSTKQDQEATLISHLEALRRALIRSLVGLTSFLFVAGVAFCLLVCFPLIVEFGMSFAGDSLTPVFGVLNLVSLRPMS